VPQQDLRPGLIAQIGAANDIAEVNGAYVSLRRIGTVFSGLCPFHIERMPSFMVNSQGQMFFCFGCGAGGSVFEFVMKCEHIDFIAAVRKLAERAGTQFPGDEAPGS